MAGFLAFRLRVNIGMVCRLMDERDDVNKPVWASMIQ